MKKVLKLLGLALVLLIAVLLFNTFTFTSKQITVDPITKVEVSDEAISRFQGAIKFSTISHNEVEKFDSIPFIELHNYIAESFPLVDSLLVKRKFGYTLLYEWTGTDNSAQPIVFMSHMDVVPVDMVSIEDWDGAPFSGELKNGKIYGRGTMDDKVTMMATLEAVEMHLAAGTKPKQTIYLSFGHDEEIGGEQGALKVAEWMKANGIKPSFVMDEGGFIADGSLAGLEKDMAVINVAEKGFVSYKITVRTGGGHSSSPPKDNTVGSLATAITKLEKNQFKTRMVSPVDQNIRYLGPEMPFLQKMLFANTWLTGGLLLDQMGIRTSTAPTIIGGGVKDNVIPTEAFVVVNFRILQGESSTDVYNHIIETIDDDRFSVELYEGANANEPSAVAEIRSDGYNIIEKTIKQITNDAIVVPGLIGGGTDAKHFIGVADNTYRFFPMRISPSNMTGFHGTNEHMEVENYKEIIQFVHQMIINLNN
jgi:carboxypeptidase PM20D1